LHAVEEHWDPEWPVLASWLVIGYTRLSRNDGFLWPGSRGQGTPWIQSLGLDDSIPAVNTAARPRNRKAICDGQITRGRQARVQPSLWLGRILYDGRRINAPFCNAISTSKRWYRALRADHSNSPRIQRLSTSVYDIYAALLATEEAYG